jgi:hypothetical protein
MQYLFQAMLHRDSSQVPPTGSAAPTPATSQAPMQQVLLLFLISSLRFRVSKVIKKLSDLKLRSLVLD